MDDLILDSLRRRMRAVFSLYEDATQTMDLEHVNHFEREGVLPIAFSLFHIVNMIDSSFMLITGEMPTWNDEWKAKVNMSIADHGKHKTVDEMIDQRIGDYEAFKQYMGVVFSRVETWLAALDPAELSRVVIARPFPPQISSTFSARVAGDEGIKVLDAVECWIYQHALRHLGELEHDRGLVGLHGMTS
ncbi:MAG: DinB family protein [Actinomycetota bacterium]